MTMFKSRIPVLKIQVLQVTPVGLKWKNRVTKVRWRRERICNFKADFKHAIEGWYTKRDLIAFLRTCLQRKPLDLIKGTGTDYDATWEYLDSIYGDPRFVSGTITQDGVKFRTLQNGEDTRFCDLVHLVKRCYNTLKEVGVPSDIDKSHAIHY